MQKHGLFWRETGLPLVAALALVGGLGLYGYSFWAGRAYWPLAIDYSYLYVAGRLWSENESPYGDAVPLAAHAFIGRDMAPFVYPPNWYGPTRLLALFDPATSNLIWFFLSTAMLAASAWLIAASVLAFSGRFTPLARALVPVEPARRATLLLAALFAGFVAATKGAGVGAYLGQTSMLAFFGQALLIYGAVKQRRTPIVAGLVILLLKPQLGLAYAFVLLFDRRTRASVLAAGAITAVLALPGLMVGGPVEAIRQFLAGVAAYGARAENLPDAMSSLGNPLWLAFGLQFSAFAWLGAAALAGLAGGLLLRRRFGAENGPIALIVAVTLASGLLVPLHDWDFLLFAPLVGLLFFLEGRALLLALAATLLLTRLVEAVELLAPENSWIAHQRVSALMATLAMLVALAAGALALRRPPAAPSRAAD